MHLLVFVLQLSLNHTQLFHLRLLHHLTGSEYKKNRAIFFRHNKMASGAFLDSHVEMLEKRKVPCKESYPDASEESIKNTFFNSGKVDTNMETIGNL